MIGAHQELYNLLDFVSQKLEQPIPLVFAYQNASRIMKPYGSIRIDTIQLPGHEVYGPVNEIGWRDYGGWRKATVELQVYGYHGGPIAREFALRLQSNSAIEYAQTQNVAIGNRLFLSEVPVLMNESQYEERGIYQFHFFYTDQIDDEVGLIEQVIIEQLPPMLPVIPIVDVPPGGTPPPNNIVIVPPPDTVTVPLPMCELVIEAYPPHTPPSPGP